MTRSKTIATVGAICVLAQVITKRLNNKKIIQPSDGRLEQLIGYFRNIFKNNITDTEKEWICLFDNEMSWFYYKRNNGSSWCGILATLGLHCPETCQDIRDIWDLMEDEDRDGFFRDTMVMGYTNDIPP